ncbi:MAG: peptidoglycan-binding protein [Defluviimonas sp.]|nr:peptidoglycan-binding protein [Defluviimonas sp.]
MPSVPHSRFPLLLAALLAALPARAADTAGRYAVDGIGSQPCRAFTQAADDGAEPLIAAYGGWLGGFITAYNIHTPQTFDVTPWQTTELLLAKLDKHCRTFPDRPFVEAAGALIATLQDARLTEASELVSIRAGGRGVYLPRAELGRIAAALAASGFPVATAAGEFDPAFSDALMAFQAARGLEKTGLPDQNTLNALFP